MRPRTNSNWRSSFVIDENSTSNEVTERTRSDSESSSFLSVDGTQKSNSRRNSISLIKEIVQPPKSQSPLVSQHASHLSTIESSLLSSPIHEAMTIADEVFFQSVRSYQKILRDSAADAQRQLKDAEIESKNKDQTISELQEKVVALQKSLDDKNNEMMMMDTKVKINEKKINAKEIEIGLVYHKLKKLTGDISEKDQHISALTTREAEVQNDSDAFIRLLNEKLLLFEEKSAAVDSVLASILKSKEGNAPEGVGIGGGSFRMMPRVSSLNKRRDTVVAGDKAALAGIDALPAAPKPKDSIDSVIKETRLNKIRDIELTPGLKITPEQIDTLASVLKLNTTVEYISFSKIKIGDHGAKKIAEALMSNHNVQGLNLEYSGLTFDGAKAVLDMLKSNNTIHTLNFAGNLLNDHKWSKAVSEVLSSNHPSLVRLSLAGTMLGASGMREVVQGLESNKTITSLDLSGNNLREEGCATLCDCIVKMGENPKLESLSLWGNMIGVAGAKSIAALLNSNKKLQKLNLKGNNLRAEGARILSQAVIASPSLTLLDLSGNMLGVDGAKEIANMMSSNSQLIEVNVGGNHIGNEGAASVCRAVKTHPSLKYLNMELNMIENNGLAELYPVLAENTSLIQIDLGFNKIDIDGALAIKNAVGPNTALKEIVFRGNVIPGASVDLIRLSKSDLENLKNNASSSS